jgi:hypothetical protein
VGGSLNFNFRNTFAKGSNSPNLKGNENVNLKIVEYENKKYL